MSCTRKEIIAQAEKWLGCKESNGTHRKIIDKYNSHTPRARGYKLSYYDPWCAGYVSASAIACNATDIIPTEVSCSKMIELLKKKGIWVEKDSYVPEMADIIFYDWDDSGSGENKGAPEHVGLVQKVKDGYIYVLEGNYNNAVAIRKLKVNGRFIRGFGVPKYKEEKKVTTTTKKAETSTTKKSVAEVAKEVIDGKWGDGDARKKALKKAGYDYDAVQKKVNELLKSGAKKSITAVAKDVIAGVYGNGETRKKKLKAAGYDYDAVQDKVNELSGKR